MIYSENEVLEALKEGKEIVVKDTWFFSGLYWQCARGCCDGLSDDYEHALETIMFFADDAFDLIEIRRSWCE